MCACSSPPFLLLCFLQPYSPEAVSRGVHSPPPLRLVLSSPQLGPKALGGWVPSCSSRALSCSPPNRLVPSGCSGGPFGRGGCVVRLEDEQVHACESPQPHTGSHQKEIADWVWMKVRYAVLGAVAARWLGLTLGSPEESTRHRAVSPHGMAVQMQGGGRGGFRQPVHLLP